MRLERPVFEQVHLRSKCTEKKRQRRGFEVTAFVESRKWKKAKRECEMTIFEKCEKRSAVCNSSV